MNERLSLYSGMNSPKIRFRYRNWKGECGIRTIEGAPMFWYGTSQYHQGAQWFIKAHDSEKNAVRDFAVVDILEFLN